MEPSEPQATAGRSRELVAFLLLTVVVIPLFTVLLVAGYGFAVWMWQVFVAGPPTGP